MNMKKLIAGILIAAMTAGLAACGNSGSSAATTAAAKQEAKQEQAAGNADGSYEPNGTLTIIVPYKAGGAVDLGSRLLAKYLSSSTPVDVVISNVAGGGGTVGAADCLKYPADGAYMLALNPSPTYVSTKDKPVTFDILQDFTYCAMMVRDHRLYVVSKSNPNFSTVEEAIEYGKANPGKFNIACSGSGNTSYMAAETFLTSTGITGNVVPFDGGSEEKSELLGGHVDMAVLAYSEYMSSKDDLTVLATGGEERFDKLPDVPCMTELGFPMSNYVTRGFAMKSGTDEAVIKYWSDKIGEACANEDFLKEAEDLGLPIEFMDYKTAQEDAIAEMTLYREVFGD